MKEKKNNLMSLEQFKDKHYGKPGTKKREELEEGYEEFKLGAMLLEARIEKGLTQEELAVKVGTTKSYISKIENNIKDGQLELSIKL
jgi:DNA-binding XRE family transcriptional regulator